MRRFAALALLWLAVGAPRAAAQCPLPEYDEVPHAAMAFATPVLADLDGDGLLDLVSGGDVLVGRGDGTFEEARPILAGTGRAISPLVADVNGDGAPDVVVEVGDAVDGCAGGGQGVAYVSHAGAFTRGEPFWGAGRNVPADWDRDGHIDLVGGGEGADRACTFVVRRGDGRGRFGALREIGAEAPPGGVGSLALVDFDRDGLVDLVTAEGTGGNVCRLRVLRQAPDGGVSPRHDAAYEAAAAGPIRIADVDGDGWPDVVVRSAGGLTWWREDESGALRAAPIARVGAAVLDHRLADLNGDGIADIALVTQRQGARALEILCGEGGGTFTACGAWAVGPFASWLVTGDVNGDGRLDVIVGGSQPFSVFLARCEPRGRLVGVIPTVTSDRGAFGARFQTRLRVANGGTEPAAGRLVFHPRWREGRDDDPGLDLHLAPFQTNEYGDLMAALGASGSGSLDVLWRDGPSPDVEAEVFNAAVSPDARGAYEAAVSPRELLTAGTGGTVGVPADLTGRRVALGIRTLAEGLDLQATVRDRAGVVVGTVRRRLGPSRLVQEPAASFLGRALQGGESVALTVLEGSGVAYVTTADEATSTPSLEIVRRSLP